MISIKSPREIELMREAGRITALAHQEIKKLIKPGVSTQELDAAAEKVIRLHGAIPSFQGQEGFNGSIYQASICASINDEVVHGIPGNRILNDGDIISIDIGACYEGYHSDAAITHPVGTASSEALNLIKITELSFYEGLKFAKEGNRLTDISHAVQSFVESNGFSVVREFVGHGVGRELQEEPQIPNFGKPGYGPRLIKGMTIAIEPMVNMGEYPVKVLQNNWTVVTYDGSLSSHYENTILVTEGEPEILSKC